MWKFDLMVETGNKMKELKNLIQIPQGSKAIVKAIRGGHGLIQKLQAIGIREGKEIEKVSTGIAHGPVVLRCGNTEVAIGFGMARKVFIEEI